MFVICEDTGMLANEECPNKKEIVYSEMPKMEQNARWNTTYGREVQAPPSEHCTEHVNTIKIEEESKEDKTDENKKDETKLDKDKKDEENSDEDEKEEKTNTVTIL